MKVDARRALLGSSLVFLAGGAAMALWAVPRFREAAGGLAPLDGRLFFRPRDVGPILSELGEYGRQAYSNLLIADFFFVPAYVLFLSLFNRRYWSESAAMRALPLLLGALDMVENLTVVRLLATWPEANDVLAALLSVVSAAKWLCVAISYGAIPAALFKYLAGARRAAGGQR